MREAFKNEVRAEEEKAFKNECRAEVEKFAEPEDVPLVLDQVLNDVRSYATLSPKAVRWIFIIVALATYVAWFTCGILIYENIESEFVRFVSDSEFVKFVLVIICAPVVSFILGFLIVWIIQDRKAGKRIPSAIEEAREKYFENKRLEKENMERQARKKEEKRKAEEERKKREAERLAKIEAERQAAEEKARKEEEARLAAEAEAERKRQEFLDQEKARIKEEIRAQRLKDRSGGEG